MKKYIYEYLSFTRRERAGILILLTLCLLSYTMPALYPLIATEPQVDFSTFEREALALEAARSAPDASPVLFNFDPNRVSFEELQALGLSARTARTILNYRSKGGRFHRKSDLRKIYTLQESEYRRLAPFIQLPADVPAPVSTEVPEETVELFPFDPMKVSIEELRRLGLSRAVAGTFIRFREKGGTFEKPEDLKKVYGLRPEDADRLAPYARFPKPSALPGPKRSIPQVVSPPSAPEPLRVDINRASAEDWAALYGIGPVLSGRIVRFREKLGGFCSVEQVGETYGLPDSTFERIREQLEESPVFRPLAVNQLGWEALAEHPYLSRRQARALVAYRRQHGPFSNARDLDRVLALPEEVRTKMAPYWIFDRGPLD